MKVLKNKFNFDNENDLSIYRTQNLKILNFKYNI